MLRRTLLASAVALATSVVLLGGATAHDYTLGDLKIDHPWSRATPGPIRTGAVYMTVTTDGTTPDRLIGAETPRAARAELHAHLMDGDVMRMRQVTAVEIHPGEPAVFKPGGLHLMLVGLTAPLREKERFPLTLIFEKAGRIDVEVVVQSPGARSDGHQNHEGHGHGS